MGTVTNAPPPRLPPPPPPPPPKVKAKPSTTSSSTATTVSSSTATTVSSSTTTGSNATTAHAAASTAQAQGQAAASLTGAGTAGGGIQTVAQGEASYGSADMEQHYGDAQSSTAASSTAASTATTPNGTGQLGTDGPKEGTPLFTAFTTATGAQQLYAQASQLPNADAQTINDATNAYMQAANAYNQALHADNGSWAQGKLGSFATDFPMPTITASGLAVPLQADGTPVTQVDGNAAKAPDQAQFHITEDDGQGNAYAKLKDGYIAPPPIPTRAAGESDTDYGNAMEQTFQSMTPDQTVYAGWLIGQYRQGKQINISDADAQQGRTDAIPAAQLSPQADGAHDSQAWSAMTSYLESSPTHAAALQQEDDQSDPDGGYVANTSSDGMLNSGYFASHPPGFGQSLLSSLSQTVQLVTEGPALAIAQEANGGSLPQWVNYAEAAAGALTVDPLALVKGAYSGVSTALKAATGAGTKALDGASNFAASGVGAAAESNTAALTAADANLEQINAASTADTAAATGSDTAAATGDATASATYGARGGPADLDEIVVVPNGPKPILMAQNTQPMSAAERAAFESDPQQVAQLPSSWPQNSGYASQGSNFANGQIGAGDIRQGLLDDCGPAAAFGVLSRTEDGQSYIKSLFSDETDTSTTVRVGDSSISQSKMLPVNSQGAPLANNPETGQGSWFSYWEGAAAKEGQANGEGGYNTFKGGTNFQQVVDKVFGSNAGPQKLYATNGQGWTDRANNAAASTADVQKLLSTSTDPKTLTLAGTVGTPTNGLTGTHWYGVLGTTPDGSLVKVFDPWGTNARPAGALQNPDGTLYLPIKTFLQNFNSVGRVAYSP